MESAEKETDPEGKTGGDPPVQWAALSTSQVAVVLCRLCCLKRSTAVPQGVSRMRFPIPNMGNLNEQLDF